MQIWNVKKNDQKLSLEFLLDLQFLPPMPLVELENDFQIIISLSLEELL